MMHKHIVRNFKRLSFRQKLLFSYVIVAIIPIIVLGLFSYNKAKGYLHEQQRMSMNETISQITSSMDEKLRRQDEFVNFISFNTVLREVIGEKDLDPFSLQQKMNDSVESAIWYYLSVNKEIKRLSIYSEGRDEGVGSFIMPAAKVEDETWYLETKKHKKTQWWYKDRELFAAHSILNRDSNRIIGAVCLKLDMDSIIEDVKTKKIFKYGFIIRDTSGKIITYQDASYIIDDYGRQMIIDSKGDDKGIAERSFIIIRSRIPTTGWTLFGYIPKNEVIVDTRGILVITASIIGVCVILLVLIILLFSRAFVNRIMNLYKKIEIVEAGDLGIEISSESGDEIGRLTNKFGNMLNKINSLIEEVYQSEIDRKEALLKALQAQINPHFLYNSLSMINWKAIDAGEKEISDITKLLSKFYRTTLNKGISIISIRDEIGNIKAYIDIQLMMHDNEFKVVYEVDEEIFEYDMLNFTLQPIVENAILHGVDEREEGEGLLKISGRMRGNSIELLVEDNGPGIDKENICDLLEKDSTGYGLKNISERIKLYFGQEYGIAIESEPGKSTQVAVSLPAYKNNAAAAHLLE